MDKNIKSNYISFRITGCLVFLNLFFVKKTVCGEGKLHLISDETYVYILQYLGGKWLKWKWESLFSWSYIKELTKTSFFGTICQLHGSCKVRHKIWFRATSSSSLMSNNPQYRSYKKRGRNLMFSGWLVDVSYLNNQISCNEEIGVKYCFIDDWRICCSWCWVIFCSNPDNKGSNSASLHVM